MVTRRRPQPPSSCRSCGEPARRWRDGRGRPNVNLEPTTGLCVRCLTNFRERVRVLDGRQEQRPMPFDARAAAARNDD